MVWAYQSESHAPPFGIVVHDSALTNPQLANPDDGGFPKRLWRWWKDEDETDAKKAFRVKLTAYFDYSELNQHNLQYSIERIKKHRELADEYFRVES